MTETGIALVQARIAQIQSRFGVRAAPVTANPTGGLNAASFADALARARAPETAASDGGDVITAARRYLGVPYLWGGTDPSTGLDCSGLVQRVYRDLGVSLPRTAAEQATVGQPVPSLAQAQPGDLLFFDNSGNRAGIDHVAIYVGGGRMIEAPRTGLDVRETEVPGTPVAIRRIGGSSLQGLFAAAGARYGVDPALLSAVAKAESSYQPDAVSPAGAQGLMQLMPRTAAGLGVDPFDPSQAVDGAARLLSGYLKQFGSVPLALAAYNAGPNAVLRYGGVPPYAETQNYVRTIQSYLEASA